jgi:hypothetical protein
MPAVQAIIDDIKTLRSLDAASLARLDQGDAAGGPDDAAEQAKARLRTTLAEYDQALEILSGL